MNFFAGNLSHTMFTRSAVVLAIAASASAFAPSGEQPSLLNPAPGSPGGAARRAERGGSMMLFPGSDCLTVTAWSCGERSRGGGGGLAGLLLGASQVLCRCLVELVGGAVSPAARSCGQPEADRPVHRPRRLMAWAGYRLAGCSSQQLFQRFSFVVL